MVRRRGIALPIVLSVVFVLSAFVFALARYQRHHITVTGVTANDIAALAAAEAGISVALGELEASPRWATHEIVSFDPSGEVQWGTPLARPQKSRVAAGFQLATGGQGTLEGSVGAPPYQGHFKVKAGYLPSGGATVASGTGGQASARYLYLEALGMKSDPTGKQDRATRVRLMVERINFTEYLLYDGGWLTIGMGSENDPDSFNIFADGRLYGHQWVHLGDISPSGTQQKWVNLTSIRSGGPIRTASSYQIHFQADPNVDGTPSTRPGFTVPFHPGNDSASGNLETGQGRILDGDQGGALKPPGISEDMFRVPGAIQLQQTKAGDFQTRPQDSYPDFDARQFVEVDFGRAMYGPGPGDDGNPEGLNAPYPADFNGIIFSPVDMVVWGAPDRDVTLVSAKDIFLAGDFNVRHTHRQDYAPDFVSELNEDDASARVQDAPYYSYVHRERFTQRDLPGGQGWERLPDDQADRRSCAVAALGNVWRDFRLPGRFLRNELIGLMAWELAENLAIMVPPPGGADPATWQAQLKERMVGLEDDGSAMDFEVQIPGFAPASLTPDAEGIPQLGGPLDSVMRSMFPWTPSDGEDASEARCRTAHCQGSNLLQLSDAQATPPRVPQYWLAWYVTKESKVQIHQLVGQALNQASGRITDELLYGDGGQDPGLLDRIYQELLKDERRWAEFKGIGGPGGFAPEHSTRLALGNAPQRLYNLVRDEPGTDILDKVMAIPGQAPNAGPGPRSDHAGKRPEMQRDRLWMPQQTLNAMVFVNAKKNDTHVPDGDPRAGNLQRVQDATTVDRRFYELGDPRAKGLHYLTMVRTRNGDSGNIKAPFIQRIRGAYIRYAKGDAQLPRMGSGFYWPPIRRRIYDPDLVVHPPPFIPAEAKVRSWTNLGATVEEFQGF